MNVQVLLAVGQTIEYKSTNLCLISIVTLLLLNQPVTVWGQFLDLGGPFFGNPSCASAGVSEVTCGHKATDNFLVGVAVGP
jgi:hypothetical protein